MPVIRVKKVTIVTFKDYEETLLRELGRLGVVDLKPLREEDFAGFKKVISEDLHKYGELMDRLKSLFEKLGDGERVKRFEGEITEKVPVVELEAKISSYEKELGWLEAEISSTEKQLEYLKETREYVELLNKFNIRPGDVGIFKHMFIRVGFINSKDLRRLRDALLAVPQHIIKEYSVSKERSLVTIAGLNEFRDDIMKVLRAVNFEEIVLPDNIPKEYEEAIKWIEDEIAKNKEKLQQLNNRYEELKRRFFKEADYLRKAIRYSYRVSNAQSKLLRSKEWMTLLQGWIPEDRKEILDRFLNAFREKLSGKIMVVYSDPSPHEKPPTVLRAPKLFRAYLSLVRQYGVPEPYELDPTPVAGILWTIMFGFMFPDLGQGIVIALLGLLFIRMKRNELMGIPIKSVGRLMIGAGIFAAVFGALTGDVFLFEHIIEPLWPGLAPGWLEKASNVVWLIKIAIYFGIMEISIGLFLNMYNNLKHGHKLEALLGEKGLAGLITFWSIVLAAFAFIGLNVIPGVFEFPGVNLAEYLATLSSFNIQELFSWPNITLTIPIITLFIGIIGMISKGIIGKEELSLTFGMLFETLISFFSNMLSFVRLAGFNIAHVALALVIAKMLESSVNLGIVMLVGLNFFALTLELIVVMIQSLRLTFYEFMTKFYKGTGEPFRPFRIGIS